SLCGSGTYSR
ncbi:hypothetical protein D041_0319B, partial [Vibrio parahaemolyticus EKP-008]